MTKQRKGLLAEGVQTYKGEGGRGEEEEEKEKGRGDRVLERYQQVTRIGGTCNMVTQTQTGKKS